MKSNNATSTAMQSSQLMSLFEEQLKDIYWAEKALTKALPKMIKNAQSDELVEALTSHLEETKGQVERLEKVFKSLNQKAEGKKCDAMEGLLKESEEIMEFCEKGPMCDAGIILASQKVEHYEIASYGTLSVYAKVLGNTEVEALLKETLEEEKKADVKLSKIAQSINVEAAEEVESK